jgi:formate-nitrite transporter family protein
MKKHIWKIVFIVVVVLMGGSFLYANHISSQANEGVVITDHIKGNEQSKVTLTEYSDFQCPACGQFYPIVKELLSQYGDQIRFEYKHFPLLSIHPYAMPAAKAAEAAGQQGKFFEMHDKLFENQNTWAKSPTPQVYFLQYAQELGLDMPRFKKQLASSVIEDHIKDQFNEAQELGLTGTPSFYLNGERLEFQTFEEFFGAIEAALGITPESGTSTASTSATDSVKFGI